VLVVVGPSVRGAVVLIVDLSGTALEFRSHRPISKKHKVGELARCFICQQGVGVTRATRCILCSRFRHKTCLPIQDPNTPSCPSCTTITQAAQSNNPQDLADALNKSANLVDNGLEDGENNSLVDTSDEEEEGENLSQSAPKMDAEAVKALLQELKDDFSAQNQKNAEALIAQVGVKMTEQAEQFNDALSELRENVDKVQSNQNEQRGDWGDDEEQHNQTAIAPNQSSRDEDGLNASLQDQRNSAQINKRNETAVKETRKSSRSRDDKQSQDARRKEHNRTNDAQNQNYGPPPTMHQPPPSVQHAQQQNAQTHSNAQHRQPQNRPSDFQQSPPLNLSMPPNHYYPAQGNQLRPGGQAAQYEDRSRVFRPS
ncbi:MAG: hypothetical protein GY820_44335, partial [Gammaproteobacteria bacterium]|nr:hypothetical protein [Gammaproteobacteria bacterium]